MVALIDAMQSLGIPSPAVEAVADQFMTEPTVAWSRLRDEELQVSGRDIIRIRQRIIGQVGKFQFTSVYNKLGLSSHSRKLLSSCSWLGDIRFSTHSNGLQGEHRAWADRQDVLAAASCIVPRWQVPLAASMHSAHGNSLAVAQISPDDSESQAVSPPLATSVRRLKRGCMASSLAWA